MKNEAFIRWQERTQNLRTHSISVFLGITLGSIGFIISQILDKDFEFRNCYVSAFLMISVLVLLINTVLLLLLVINRLKGFRLTTQIVRKKDIEDIDGIDKLREQSVKIDNKTHYLFNASIIIFSIGQLLAVVGFTIQIWTKF